MSVTAVIVQARMKSTRLPGKVMLELAAHSVLHHVLQRCAAIPGVDVVCCATTDGSDTDLLSAEAKNSGAEVFRGSEHDVLDRYYQAAKMVGADVIMRVTSDCPLIDPEICGRLLDLRAQQSLDYACNNMPAGWPHGLDCEIFTFAALQRAAAAATDPYDREHVTPWLRKNSKINKSSLSGPGGTLRGHRWTLDFPEDFAFFKALFAYLPPLPAIPTLDEVLAILDRHPEIVAINQCRQGVSRPS